MVTKITVDFPTKFSMVKDKPPGVYGALGFDHAAFIEEVKDHLEKIRWLVSLFEVFPNANVKESINIFFGECNISVTEKTKKKRVYGIWLCYIHEED
jgi:hypothetical protein